MFRRVLRLFLGKLLSMLMYMHPHPSLKWWTSPCATSHTVARSYVYREAILHFVMSFCILLAQYLLIFMYVPPSPSLPPSLETHGWPSSTWMLNICDDAGQFGIMHGIVCTLCARLGWQCRHDYYRDNSSHNTKNRNDNFNFAHMHGRTHKDKGKKKPKIKPTRQP